MYQDIVWKLCLLDGILSPPFTLLLEKSRVQYHFFIPYHKNWPWEGETPTGHGR